MKNKILATVAVALFGTLSLCAQTTKEEVLGTIEKTAGVYFAYPSVENNKVTPAPKGYTPFYISHFGRHGSRYLLAETDYTDVIRTMENANKANALTPLGKDALNRLHEIYKEAEGRAEDLSPLGVRQHRGIAERMYRNYPQVFADGRTISARSSIVLRCAMSMAAFGDRLKELNPKLSIYYESSRKYMGYLTSRSDEANAFTGNNGPWRIEYEKFRRAHTHSDRFVKALFCNDEYVLKNIDPFELVWDFYWVASDMQNMETPVSFYDLFTPDELYDLWQCFNYQFYCTNANHAAAKGAIMNSYKDLLRNIVESADAAIADGNTAATLRFAHDSNITPLTALMGIENCDACVSDPYTVYQHWTDFKVSPMAANLQLVFFKKKGRTADDILVKVLHNEKEVHIPVATDQFPFYRWTDVRSYYTDLLTK